MSMSLPPPLPHRARSNGHAPPARHPSSSPGAGPPPPPATPSAGPAAPSVEDMLAHARGIGERLGAGLRSVVLGQDDVLLGVVIGLLAAGHVLLEGAPGLGKTLLVRTLARALDLHVLAHPVHARPDAERRRRDEPGR